MDFVPSPTLFRSSSSCVSVCTMCVCVCFSEDRLAFVFLAHYYYAWDILPQFHVFYHIWRGADTGDTQPNERTFIRMSPSRHTMPSLRSFANVCECAVDGLGLRLCACARDFLSHFSPILFSSLEAKAEHVKGVEMAAIHSSVERITSHHNNRLYISYMFKIMTKINRLQSKDSRVSPAMPFSVFSRFRTCSALINKLRTTSDTLYASHCLRSTQSMCWWCQFCRLFCVIFRRLSKNGKRLIHLHIARVQIDLISEFYQRTPSKSTKCALPLLPLSAYTTTQHTNDWLKIEHIAWQMHPVHSPSSTLHKGNTISWNTPARLPACQTHSLCCHWPHVRYQHMRSWLRRCFARRMTVSKTCKNILFFSQL